MDERQKQDVADVVHSLKVTDEKRELDEQYAEALRAKFGEKADD